MNIDARFFALAVFGIALLTGMDALAKALAGGYGTFQIVFFRYAVSLLLFAAAIPLLRPQWPRRERLRAHAARAVLTMVTGVTFFYALGKLPFTEVFAIAYTGPIFVALFGALLQSATWHFSARCCWARKSAGRRWRRSPAASRACW